MNILFPLAGNNLTEDKKTNKFLQEIKRKTLIEYVLESLQDINANKFVAFVKKEDIENFRIDKIVRLINNKSIIIPVESFTGGAACTCMLAVDTIENNEPLLIVGSDQVFTTSVKKIADDFQRKKYDGGVAIFEDINPRWSFVKLDNEGYVVQAAEKQPISRNACAGLYYFKTANIFFDAVKKMIRKKAIVNGKYYICPAFNEMILEGLKIGTYRIEKDQYYNMNSSVGFDSFKEYIERLTK